MPTLKASRVAGLICNKAPPFAALHNWSAFCMGAEMLDLALDPVDSPWWNGYMLGLRRAAGEPCAPIEHARLLSAVDSMDAHRSAMANGYKAGLMMIFHPAEATA